MSYQARCYIRRVLSALALAIVIFVIRREWHLTGFSNAMAISGICFLIMALFQTARYLRCYDLIIFGFLKFKQLWKNEKLMDKHTGSYGEFLENRRYEKNYGETFAAAVCMFVCSAVVLVI